MTVSDELVERVAQAIEDGLWADLNLTMSDVEAEVVARAAIAALSTPEFVLAEADRIMRATNIRVDTMHMNGNHGLLLQGTTLAFAYRRAKGE